MLNLPHNVGLSVRLNLPHNVGLSVRLTLPHNVGLSVRLSLPHNAAKLIFLYSIVEKRSYFSFQNSSQ